MKYFRHLYLSKGLEKKKDKMIKKLEQKKVQMGTHLIVLPEDERNHLEILHSIFLLQKNYPVKDYFVVGITENHEDALEIVEKITQEVYDNTKGTDIRAYIMRREREK